MLNGSFFVNKRVENRWIPWAVDSGEPAKYCRRQRGLNPVSLEAPGMFTPGFHSPAQDGSQMPSQPPNRLPGRASPSGVASAKNNVRQAGFPSYPTFSQCPAMQSGDMGLNASSALYCLHKLRQIRQPL